ncbi:MAG: hypothetical protein JWN30_1162, partial [Bacilli bacterium]|nr:hypothetical protein [Bacilli bacterium]
YPNSPEAQKSIMLFNNYVIQSAAVRTGARLAPVFSAFEGRQMQLIEGYSDGRLLHPGTRGVRFPIHPNPLGHSVIAQTFYSVL